MMVVAAVEACRWGRPTNRRVGRYGARSEEDATVVRAARRRGRAADATARLWRGRRLEGWRTGGGQFRCCLALASASPPKPQVGGGSLETRALWPEQEVRVSLTTPGWRV